MSLPYVATDIPKGQEGHHRTLIANTVNALVKVRPPNDATEVEVDLLGPNYPLDTTYPPFHIRRYGAVLDNVTDDYQAIQYAIDAAYNSGGGYVYGFAGLTALVKTPPIVKDRVTLDLDGGWLRINVVGDEAIVATQYGLRMRSNSRLYDGKVSRETSGNYGSQAAIASAINIGALQGEAGTVASPGADAFVDDVIISGVEVTTDKDNRCGIVMLGGITNVLLENITVPDSDKILAAVQVELSFLGTLSSTTPATNRTAFDGGTAYTLHPSGITGTNIKCGVLDKAYGGEDVGSHALRLICPGPNINFDGISAEQTTYATVRHTTNGMGYEFAPADVKRTIGQNIVVRNVTCFNTSEHWLLNHDGYSNQQDIVGYTPIRDTLFPANFLYENFSGSQQDPASGTDAVVLIQKTRGGVFRNFSVRQGYDGIRVDEKTHGILIEGGQVFENRRHGLLISATSNQPEDIVVRGMKAFSNGQTDAAGGIVMDGCTRITIEKCHLGREYQSGGASSSAADPTQNYGVRATSDCTHIKIIENHFHSVEVGGACISVGSGATDSYQILDKVSGNTFADNIKATERWSGVDIIPYAIQHDTNGYLLRRCKALNASTPPTAGTWRRGEIIECSDFAASTSMGDACVTSGTFSAATDNTGDTDGSTAVITGMADTSDFFAGEFVTLSAGFATTGPYLILSKTSTSITVDVNSNSVQANITVSTPDPVFKTLPALGA